MNAKYTVLVVDDSKTNLSVINAVLSKKYNVILEQNGDTALKYLEKERPDLVLLDLIMPEIDGRDVYRKMREIEGREEIPVIFLTADQSEATEAECLKMGAADFITKPIVPEVLLMRIDKTIELEEYRRDMQKKLHEKQLELEAVSLQMIAAIADTIDARDEETNGHSIRVADYSLKIAQGMGFSEEDAQYVYQSALLHDVGKIGVPDKVLKKAGKLDEDEYIIIKSHTNIGAKILREIKTVPYISDGAQYHHERYDGKGYPQGLKGDEIPLIGRIIAVADAYDALTSRRVYKEHIDKTLVLAELERNAGLQFDPEIVKVFLQIISEE